MDTREHILDPHGRLAFESSFTAAVLGRSGKFVLLPMNPGITAAEEAAVLTHAAEQKFHYAGILGVVDGLAQARCEPDLDSILTMVAAGMDFAVLAAEYLRAQMPKGDEVDWLQALHALPDGRVH